MNLYWYDAMKHIMRNMKINSDAELGRYDYDTFSV